MHFMHVLKSTGPKLIPWRDSRNSQRQGINLDLGQFRPSEHLEIHYEKLQYGSLFQIPSVWTHVPVSHFHILWREDDGCVGVAPPYQQGVAICSGGRRWMRMPEWKAKVTFDRISNSGFCNEKSNIGAHQVCKSKSTIKKNCYLVTIKP